MSPRRVSIELLDRAVQCLAQVNIDGTVSDSESGRYSIRLELPKVPELGSAVTEVRCWPATLTAAHAERLEDGTEFEGLSLSELSAFLAIEVRATLDGTTETRRFARIIRLTGFPEDRLPRLIAAMLRDKRRFHAAALAAIVPGPGGDSGGSGRRARKWQLRFVMGSRTSRPDGANA